MGPYTRPTVGRRARIISGFAFFQKQSAIIAQSRNPPLGNVSCRHCGEDDETPIHIICDCGRFVQHKLDTIGVHQMPEDKPKWDMESMFQFLCKEEIIFMEDCCLHIRCKLMICLIAHNVQINDTVDNALVLICLYPILLIPSNIFQVLYPVCLFN
jgi:hypothetical protein